VIFSPYRSNPEMQLRFTVNQSIAEFFFYINEEKNSKDVSMFILFKRDGDVKGFWLNLYSE
jgi:hypothetical protein